MRINKKINDSNLFNLEESKKKILVFTTQAGHLSGVIMKAIDFRLPTRIEVLKDELKINNEIGRVIETDYVVFIVLRKHYNSKVTEKQFQEILLKALPKLEGIQLKTTNEDWKQFEHIVKSAIPSIEYRESSAWPIS